jgi:CBS domain containing-hemolysin-like protein
MTEQTLIIISLVLLLIIDLVIVAARSSFVHASYVRLLALRESDELRVNRTISLILNLARVRASLNFVLVFLRFVMAGLLLYILNSYRMFNLLSILVSLLLAALVLFWIEWLLEIYIMRSPENWAMRFTSLARVLTAMLSPALALPMILLGDSNGSLEQHGTVTEDELRTLVDAGQEEGTVEEVERRMIHSVFRLSDTLVREIMVPRIDMSALEVNATLPEAVDVFVNSGYSRVPVYQDTIDNTLGTLYAKDLLKIWREAGEIESLRELMRTAYFVPEAKKVDELLEEMQSQRTHIAIVVDEYGGIAGMVTLEDIVEEIFGEIQDEYDDAEELPYQQLRDGEYLFVGRVDLDDFNDIMDSNLPSEEADTLGGYIYSRLGRVPDPGEQVKQDGLLLTVEQVSSRRIRKVRAIRVDTKTERKDDRKNADGR